MKYRREIDGLRALAVIPVVLYHAGFSLFGGGFVGVDIFFVISGYLITSIIITDLEGGNFSLSRFYERRARRILPALFFIIFVFIPLSWIWLLPNAIKSFSESVIAVSLFASNIFFYKTAGYFDSATDLKPLIHTWSLAVEEQYYFIFPLFLLAVRKYSRVFLFYFLFIVSLIGLFSATLLSATHPSFSFYLLPTRSWEILIGALIAIYPYNFKIFKSNKLIFQLLSIFGFILIIYSIFFLNDKIPYPGLYTIYPTFGAALIIIFATNETFIGRVLGSKILVSIGLISFSVYLWHQPLFAFSREILFDEPNIYLMMLLILSSFILGYVSWKYIETPFRDKNIFKSKFIFIFSLGMIGVAIFFGLVGYLYSSSFNTFAANPKDKFLASMSNTFPEWVYFTRINILEKYHSECDFYDIHSYMKGRATNIPLTTIPISCYTRNPLLQKSVFIWGDSHAQHLRYGLDNNLPPDWQILQVASSGCPAKIIQSPSSVNYCEFSNWFALKSIADSKPDVVVIAQDRNQNISNMTNLSTYLNELGIKKIIFLGPTPHWVRDLPLIIYKLWVNYPQRTLKGLDKKIIMNNIDLKNNFHNNNFSEYIDVINYFCNDNGCLTYYGNGLDGITSWDYGHLTPIASDILSRDILVKSITGN